MKSARSSWPCSVQATPRLYSASACRGASASARSYAATPSATRPAVQAARRGQRNAEYDELLFTRPEMCAAASYQRPRKKESWPAEHTLGCCTSPAAVAPGIAATEPRRGTAAPEPAPSKHQAGRVTCRLGLRAVLRERGSQVELHHLQDGGRRQRLLVCRNRLLQAALLMGNAVLRCCNQSKAQQRVGPCRQPRAAAGSVKPLLLCLSPATSRQSCVGWLLRGYAQPPDAGRGTRAVAPATAAARGSRRAAAAGHSPPRRAPSSVARPEPGTHLLLVHDAHVAPGLRVVRRQLNLRQGSPHARQPGRLAARATSGAAPRLRP